MTIDANVFVSAFLSADVNHAASADFLAAVRQVKEQVRCPSLILPECAGAVSRPSSSATLARRAVASVRGFPDIKLVSLTEARARQAAELAALHKLRGADSVYVAVAQEWDATLVTWDAEMLARGPAAVNVQTPADYLTA